MKCGGYMTRVRKRSGELQEFDRTKLIESMRRAGADEQVARGIAEKTAVVDGASTMDIRRDVVEELRKLNEDVAEAYARTVRLRAMARDDVPTGAARIPKGIERVPDVKWGQPARVRHQENRREVRVEPALETREVWLNPKEFEALGAAQGTRIAVRFLREGGGTEPPAMKAQQPQAAGPTRAKPA